MANGFLRRILRVRVPDTIVIALVIIFTYAVLSSSYFFIAMFKTYEDNGGFNDRYAPPIPSLSGEEIAKISNLISNLNEEQKIYNLDIFGPIKETTNVIVIQTHTRLLYVDALIESLSNVRGVNDSLLIFSHDVFMPSMNAKIRGIRFARVMQIFYPHSLQLHPDHFPGPDPDDRKWSSVGWSPKAAQMKLHWWWKANFVFNQIKILRNFDGVISFTEEDTYLSPDAIWMLNLMKDMMVKNECEGCEILSIAENDEVGTITLKEKRTWRWNYLPTDYSKGIVSPRITSLHMAFNRTVFEKLRKCSAMFCEYNDYNWDWTLMHLMTSPSCMENPLKNFVLLWPRLFHTGSCGSHRRGEVCEPGWYVKQAKRMTRNYASLFPSKISKLDVRSIARSVLKPAQKFGGMGNPKVIDFCTSMVQGGVR